MKIEISGIYLGEVFCNVIDGNYFCLFTGRGRGHDQFLFYFTSRAISLDNTNSHFLQKGCSLYDNQRHSVPRTTALQNAALNKPQKGISDLGQLHSASNAQCALHLLIYNGPALSIIRKT